MTETTPFPQTRPTGCPFDPATGYVPGAERMSTPAGVDVWVETRYEELRRLLADQRLSSRLAPSTHVVEGADLDRPVDPGSFIQLDGAEHARYRRLLTGEFTVRRIEALRPRVAELVDEHLDAMLATGGPVDLVRAFALPIPSLVICELLGVPVEDRPKFEQLSAVLVSVDKGEAEIEAASDELNKYMATLVEAKLEHREDDLLSRLMTQAEEQGTPLTFEELVTIGVTLLVAGHETTANMIALSTLALLRQPDQLDALRADPKLAPAAVEELLRYLSVVQYGLFRQALADIPLDDYTIRAGEYLVAAIAPANRDVRVFPDGDRIDLTRKSSRHLAFGFGAHQCLGQQLARIELQEVYARLYSRIPTLRLAIDFEDIEYKHGSLVYGPTKLPVSWS